MKCTLLVGRKTSRYDFTNHKRLPDGFDGQFDFTNLVFDSIKKAKKVAELAGVDSYRVVEAMNNMIGYSEVVLYETPNITEYYERSKREAQEFDKKQNERAERINKLPELVEIKDHGVPGCSLFINRQKYSYNRAYSRNLSGYVTILIKCGNRVVTSDFDPNVYIKRNGAVQVKRFKEDFYYDFGTSTEFMPKKFGYKALLLMLKDELKKFENKIRKI